MDSKNIPVSKEVYLLNNFKWLILENVDNIDYQHELRYNHKLKAYLNTYDYEKMFFQLDDKFMDIRRLKEKYIEFNKTKEKDLNKIEILLNDLIDLYDRSSLSMFKEFSEILKKHKQEVINSLIYITDSKGNERRLSLMALWKVITELLKTLKRNSRGLSNFEYARSRLIWSNRKNEPVLSIPKSKQKVYKFKK